MHAQFFISMSQMNRFLEFCNLYMIFERGKLRKNFLSENEHIDFQKNKSLTTQRRKKTTRWTNSELRQYYLKPAVNCQSSYRGRALSPARYLPTSWKCKIWFFYFFINFNRYFETWPQHFCASTYTIEPSKFLRI